MKRVLLNDGWRVMKGGLLEQLTGQAQVVSDVVLPYDAMVYETPTPDTRNGAQTGFYPGGQYTYIKNIDVPADWADRSVKLFFGGVYQTAKVMINGCFAYNNLHGYGEFYVDIDKYLKFGESNEIKVVANNTAMPNSRWYTGSGIYRSVELLTGGPVHIAADGVRVTTKHMDEDGIIVEVETKLRNVSRRNHHIKLHTVITGAEGTVKEDSVRATIFGGETEILRQNMFVRGAKLWDDESPALYTVGSELIEEGKTIDRSEVRTGFRTITVDAGRGMRVNGREIKLRGACIHHDNGILGAATFQAAENKRAREIKEAGFNAIRSAHNPLSREMLSACDEYGIYVMDELSDMWFEEKNTCDFSTVFDRCWEEESERMVCKDYNHPCVIMYSSGNEILDIGRESGGRNNRTFCNKLHELDNTRFTTTGCSGLNAVAAAGKLPKLLAALMKEHGIAGPDIGSAAASAEDTVSAMNMLLPLVSQDEFNAHPVLSEVLEEPGQAPDICGYNYLTSRAELEKEIHPNKPIVFTENFPADIVRIWKAVEDNHHVLGDFTWTGYDYLGEAGAGMFHYDGTKSFGSHFPDRVAYFGDINIIGCRRPTSYLREIVYGIRKEPYIAVVKVDCYGKEHGFNQYIPKDNISSWTWPGMEGMKTEVDVYSCDGEVELILNGRSLGKKPAGRKNGFTAVWEVCYEPGELVAIGYSNGVLTGRYVLNTAESDVLLSADSDRYEIAADGHDIAFVTCRLQDSKGVPNLFAVKEVTVEVAGEGVLQGYGSANPRTTRGYDENVWETYEGEVLAAVRSTGKTGEIKVRFSAEGCDESIVVIKAKNAKVVV